MRPSSCGSDVIGRLALNVTVFLISLTPWAIVSMPTPLRVMFHRNLVRQGQDLYALLSFPASS